jgi:DNA-binding LacI/PurR family transcriptional regulator
MEDESSISAPTSFDVARRAGVSQSAVSLVFGGKAAGRVGKQTQEAILQAARELGYRPNNAARTLRSGRSRFLALIVPDVSNPYFAGVLQGAEEAARIAGYSVMLAQVQDREDWQHSILDALTSRAVDGLLLCSVQPPAESEWTTLQGKAVIVDALYEGLPSIQLDTEAGMHAAMRHLFGLGHTRIAHVASARARETFQLRQKAYQDAMQTAGYQVVSVPATFSIDGARQAAQSLLQVSERPTAIVCDSDVLAVGVYKAARELGLAIPRDLSVTSFDDSLIARILDPELTTVALPARAIGEQALWLLVKVLEEGHAPAQSTVPLELVIRASTTGISANS